MHPVSTTTPNPLHFLTLHTFPHSVQTASGGLCHKCGPEYNNWQITGVGDRTARSSGSGTQSRAYSIFDGAGPSGSKKPAQKKKKTTIIKPQDKKELANLQSMCINVSLSLGGARKASRHELTPLPCVPTISFRSSRITSKMLKLWEGSADRASMR